MPRIAFTLLATLLFGSLCAEVCAADRSKPNVILIMADDVGWEAFGCYGGEDYRTPHIDALAARGIRFAHCYSTPLCTPTRVKLMTGKYSFRNYTHFGYLHPDEKTVGHLMQRAGYKTAIAGKWQLNGLYNQLPGHDDNLRPHQAGFDQYLLWQLTRARNSPGGGERFWSPPLERNGRLIPQTENDGEYGPELLCNFVCDFIQQHRDKPFFVYYPMVLVHNPFVPTPDSIGDGDRSHAANRSDGNRKQHFGDMVNYMDKVVGRIVQTVDDIGALQNTIILFTADNGTNTAITSRWEGREIRGGKGGMTDTGTRVPLVAYWKGHTPPGTVLEDPIDFTDFYATLAEAAGVRLGEHDPVDGRSFFPQLNGQPGEPRDWVLCHYQPYWNKVPGQFVRTATYKLYRDGRFYEIPADLEETHNLPPGTAGQRGEAVRKQLQAILDQCPPAPVGDGDRNTEHRPTYPQWDKLTGFDD